VYLIHQLKPTEEYLSDPWNSDRLDELPCGSFILVPEIRRAVQGEPFRYFPKGESQAVTVDSVDPVAYVHYFTIFNRCELWGMPHGSGWANELPWLLDFLEHMKSVKSQIETWHHEKAMKRINA